MTTRLPALDATALDDPDLPDDFKETALVSGGFPYHDKLDWDDYLAELERLQIELVKLQTHLQQSGERIVALFEGRDAAGKGGTIKTYLQHLNPRLNIIVALPKPHERERTQWYFQRYIEHLPAAGETMLFDRSWYNRAGVEPVMGFCTPEETEIFLIETPRFERMIVDDGIRFFKFYLDIGREEQFLRFHKRHHNPLKTWKLSDIDIKALSLWDAYTQARDTMLRASDTDYAPWTVIRGNDKRRARIEAIRTVLDAFDYAGKDSKAVGKCDDKIVMGAQRFLQDVASLS